jgi:hypothetical protein
MSISKKSADDALGHDCGIKKPSQALKVKMWVKIKDGNFQIRLHSCPGS